MDKKIVKVEKNVPSTDAIFAAVFSLYADKKLPIDWYEEKDGKKIIKQDWSVFDYPEEHAYKGCALDKDNPVTFYSAVMRSSIIATKDIVDRFCSTKQDSSVEVTYDDGSVDEWFGYRIDHETGRCGGKDVCEHCADEA